MSNKTYIWTFGVYITLGTLVDANISAPRPFHRPEQFAL